jgi:transcriptional regulator with XRE-family HTH domain
LSGRKAQRLTQAVLAVRAGVGISALRAVERGQGRLSTLSELLAALGLELRGRSLASGPLGPAMAAARRRRKQSRREVARALGVSRNTLAALEGGVGLVATLEAYGGAIGAGLYLAAAGEARTFFTHAGNSSAYHGWLTPVALADLLMAAVVRFDLDPCAASADKRRARVKARLLLTVDDDGLSVPWRGRVFVNPPYGRALKLWVRKCAGEAAAGAVVIGLVPARPDTRWWHDHIAGHADVFMLRGRLQFGDGGQSAPFPSAIVVWGASQALVTRLAEALVGAWHIPGGAKSAREG